MATKIDRLRAGHAEIQGETIAKFELFEQGFNPYSRYLDVDKVDLLLRKRSGDAIRYLEVQVKFGRLYPVGSKWEKELFDVTSWKFFWPNEFEKSPKHLFIAYVLALPPPDGYKGDVFVFPVEDFQSLIKRAPTVNSKKGRKATVYLSRSLLDQKWYLRTKKTRFGKEDFRESTWCVQEYWRNFKVLGESPLVS